MIISVTSIELKGPLKFFALSRRAMYIVKQLKKSDCIKYKSRGFWTTHYTISAWNSEDSMKKFATSGAHLEAMRMSKDIAKEIHLYSYESDKIPSWKEAKELLTKGRTLNF